MENKYVTLYSILKKAYCIKNNIEDESSVITSEGSAFRGNAHDEIRRLRPILASLGINLENYAELRKSKKSGRKYKKTEPSNYKIPRQISPIILAYLLEESKTKSIMSHLKYNKIEKISNDQILKLNNNICKLLKEEYKGNEAVLKEINEIEVYYNNIVELDKQWEYNKINIIDDLDKINRRNLDMLYVSSKDENIISFDSDYMEQDFESFYNQQMEEFEKTYDEKFNYENDENYRSNLNYEDVNVLSNYYLTLIKEIDEKWTRIVDIYIDKKTEMILNNEIIIQDEVAEYIMDECIEELDYKKNKEKDDLYIVSDDFKAFLNKNKY